MADEQGTSRRSFLGDLLTGAAGGWVALTSTSVVSAFLAACSRKKSSSASKPSEPINTDTMAPTPVYGGPPKPLQMDPPLATKYGGASVQPKPVVMDSPRPVMIKYGGPSPMKRAHPMRPKPQAMKYGGRVRRPKKYGGPRRTKYGGIRPGRKYGGRPSVKDPFR